MVKSPITFIKQVKKEIGTMNSEYEKMAIDNKLKSSEIRNSIHQKSEKFKHIKTNRAKMFGPIRSK